VLGIVKDEKDENMTFGQANNFYYHWHKEHAWGHISHSESTLTFYMFRILNLEMVAYYLFLVCMHHICSSS